MKVIFSKFLKIFGLQGKSAKETFYKILNWLTVLGLLISIFAWNFAIPNDMGMLSWIIFSDVILGVLNLVSWCGFCKAEFKREKEKIGWRIMELVLLYAMFGFIVGMRVYWVNLEMGVIWQRTWLIMVVFTSVILWFHRKKIGNIW